MDDRREEPPLIAAADDQQRLLDVQALDTRIDQLAQRRATLPELAAVAELESRSAVLRDQVVVVETEESDLGRELTKAEGDVDQVRSRAERDQKRLDAGQVSSPKELESLQHEIATLARRQGDLEEIVLDVMERLESAQSRHVPGVRSRSMVHTPVLSSRLNSMRSALIRPVGVVNETLPCATITFVLRLISRSSAKRTTSGPPGAGFAAVVNPPLSRPSPNSQ